MHKGPWDDLRFVLAVAEHGTISAAARSLGVNHATVLRRVARFEAVHGGPLFERTAQGYRLLPERAQVIEAAREVAAMMESVDRLMHGLSAPLRGTVRVATTDSMGRAVLPEVAREVAEVSKGLALRVLVSNWHHDLARLQADVAVRPAEALPDSMTGESPASLAFHAWRAPGGARRWLHHGGALARSVPGRWLAENVDPGEMTTGADSFVTLAEMVRLGLGQAYLPAIVVPPGVERVAGPPVFRVPVWVASHADLADAPRIRTARALIVQSLRARADLLSSGR